MVFNVFFNSVIALLFLLGFYQLILNIQANLKDSKWQIGVLRSMGMNKKDIESLTLVEATANILSASMLGFLVGFILSYVTINMTS